MLKKYVFLAAVLFISFIAVPAFANKASTTIDAPDKAAKGSTITFKVTISHNGNNFMHHVNWAYVKVNGKEIARWEFGAFSLPDSMPLTKEVTYTIESDDPLTIEAEANCNIHGSAGITTKKVDIE